MLTEAPDEREGIAVLKAGARGYCHRDIDGALLEKATHVVLKGEIWVGSKLIPHLLEELTVLTEQRRRDAPSKADERLGRVTPRERQIVDLLSAGASNKEIAKRLERDGADGQGAPHGDLPEARPLGTASARPVRARARPDAT